jgi:hypothetical protein
MMSFEESTDRISADFVRASYAIHPLINIAEMPSVSSILMVSDNLSFTFLHRNQTKRI